MKLRPLFTLVALSFAGLGLAHASPLAGKWTAEIDTQVGLQKYVYEFKADGDHLTGKATFERSMGNGEIELKAVKLNGDDVSFTEPFSMDGNEIPITYTGKLTGDEIKFTRNVGDFATEHFTAKRVKAAGAGPATK